MCEHDGIFRIDQGTLCYLVDHLTEMFWIRDPGQGEFIYVSPAYEQIWGRSRASLYADSGQWLESVHPEDRVLVKPLFDQPRHRGCFSEEYRILRPDGGIRWLRDHVLSLPDGANTPQHVMGVVKDITRHKLAEKALCDLRKQLRELVLRQQRDHEVLRTRIAREIHDELGQSLMALNMNAYWLLHQLPEENEQLKIKVQEMIDIIVSTVQSVRHISRELRPSMLDKQGLGATMRWYVEQFQERSGICCHAVITIDDVAMENDHTIAVYRILQEALTNILRHSDADEVTLQVLVEDKHLVMAIRDNGRGIDHNEVDTSRSFGLLGMRERATALGGFLEIDSKPGDGTRLVLKMPMNCH